VAGSVLCWAGLSLSARRMAEEPAGAMVLSTMPVSLVLAGTLTVSSWVPLETWSLAIFLGVGAAGATLHFSVIMAYRLAQAATVAPVEYAAVLWASLFGALFFGEVPNGPMVAGAGLIIAAGLIVLRARE
jgi:drug/metabolite transporter (DMT)-like permease